MLEAPFECITPLDSLCVSRIVYKPNIIILNKFASNTKVICPPATDEEV